MGVSLEGVEMMMLGACRDERRLGDVCLLLGTGGDEVMIWGRLAEMNQTSTMLLAMLFIFSISSHQITHSNQRFANIPRPYLINLLYN